MIRLFKTTSFRFTIVYVVVFAISVAALGAFFYRSTFGVVDRQTDQLIDQDMAVLSDLFREEGIVDLRRVLRDRAAWRGDGLYMLVLAPTGAFLAGNLSALPREALNADQGFFNFTYERTQVDAAGREIGVETRKGRGKMRRFKESLEAETAYLVFVARDVSGREALRLQTQREMARIAAFTIFLGVIIGLLFSRSLLRRVDSVNRTAQAIRDGDLTKRMVLNGSDDEFDALASNLNMMLDQIERLMVGMREVSDNIAHDLRSPLSRMRTRLNDALSAPNEDKDNALQATLADAERMITTFNALLSIARIESGEGAGAMERVDLNAIAEEMADLYEPAAQEAGFALSLTKGDATYVRGSRALISQALANMLDNALKYAVNGTKIDILVRRFGDQKVLLAVSDDGPGVPASDRDKVVKRFVRLERSRTSPGSGLGLSLVSAIARAHGAKLLLKDATPSIVDKTARPSRPKKRSRTAAIATTRERILADASAIDAPPDDMFRAPTHAESRHDEREEYRPTDTDDKTSTASGRGLRVELIFEVYSRRS